jgi:hypothetical protein
MFRSKIDNLDDVTKDSGLFCDPDEDMTRQEFKDEADINKVMARHGILPRPVQYGEWNFDEDLTSSVQARQEVDEAYSALPAEVRSLYPDMGSVWAAIASGALKMAAGGVEGPSSPSEAGQAPEEGARQS